MPEKRRNRPSKVLLHIFGNATYRDLAQVSKQRVEWKCSSTVCGAKMYSGTCYDSNGHSELFCFRCSKKCC
jgi:hypothetical protein